MLGWWPSIQVRRLDGRLLMHLRDRLEQALAGPGGPIGSADRLCQACVDLLAVDGAAISVVRDGVSSGTFGSSGAASRRWDGYQFDFGEGPCLDAVRRGVVVSVVDLADPEESRWPGFAEAVIADGVRSVFALPVKIAAVGVGALDLFRCEAGSFDDEVWGGAEWAAQLAALPMLDLMGSDVDWEAVGEGEAWSQLASLERVEVYQATGMLQVQLDVDAAEALVRLRGHAFANGMTVSEVAWKIVERQLAFEPDHFGEQSGGSGQ